MLKNFFAASLLLVLSVTANATPMTGITGEFDMSTGGDVRLNAAGEVTFIDFIFADVSISQLGHYAPYLDFRDMITLVTNPINVNAVVGLSLWSVEGFEFTATEVALNETNGQFTKLSIIGDVSHDDFLTTSSEFLLSFQNLAVNDIKRSGFSATVTSPAPTVPEPSTLAIFALGIIGFAASRKKKSA